MQTVDMAGFGLPQQISVCLVDLGGVLTDTVVTDLVNLGSHR